MTTLSSYPTCLFLCTIPTGGVAPTTQKQIDPSPFVGSSTSLCFTAKTSSGKLQNKNDILGIFTQKNGKQMD
jgi:hypothetical protein